MNNLSGWPAAKRSSETGSVYLTGLTAPQAVREQAARLQQTAGLSPCPLPVMIPLCESARRPSPPVPGLLPPCPFLRLSEKTVYADDWLIWPADSGGWFGQLARMIEPSPFALTGLPSGIGIPVAYGAGSAASSKYRKERQIKCSAAAPKIRWKSITISCWRVEIPDGLSWFKACVWYPVWSRRLKKPSCVT